MKRKIKAVCYGEVLFDNFPTHSKIGGAPMNVALRLSTFGMEVSMISAVGKDSSGEEIINYLQVAGVGIDLIQIDTEYPTGIVDVVLNEKGTASYNISYPVAWDKIQFQKHTISTLANSDIFVFGSLVCRDKVSRSTLLELLKHAPYKVLDMNLRSPHYTKELLFQLITSADFIKFNDEELYEVAGYLGSNFNSMEQNIKFIAQTFQTDTICVTKGAFGAVLYKEGKFFHNSGYKVRVIDTVGAGDSFLASLLYKLFSNVNSQEALDFACAVGALVAGSEGANPNLTFERITEFMVPPKSQ